MKNEKKGKLICVCNEASKLQCKNCLKGKLLKPDGLMYAKLWPKVDIMIGKLVK